MFGHPNTLHSGAIIVDGHHASATVQCVHCGCHYQIVAGSRRKRGWCSYCHGATCGASICHMCIPYEAQIEYSEAVNGKRKDIISKLVAKYPHIKTL